MSNISFSIQIAQKLIDSSDQFPVDFDLAWQWLEYSKKSNAKRFLIENFEEGTDFLIKEHSTVTTFGKTEEKILLTIDCTKMWGMMCGTAKGKEVRKYFLECERIAKKTLNNESPKKAINYYAERVMHLDAALQVPDGYFSVLEHCGHILLKIEQLGYPVDKFDLADGSIGKQWATYRRKELNLSDTTRKARYTFADIRGTQFVNAYSIQELPQFVSWLKSYYVTQGLPKYLKTKYGSLAIR
jgi:phage anti-repressor protein